MKKLVTIAMMMVLGMSAVLSQSINDTIFLPNHVTGRTINSSDVVTNQYPADFHYNSEGQLSSFEYPERNLTSQLVYDNHYLSNITTHYYNNWGYGQDITGTQVLEFENGLIQMELYQEFEATFENDDRDYKFYYYNDEGQLIRKEQGYTPTNICHIWTYTYDNQGKTDSMFYYISWGCPGLTKLSGIYDYQYEDDLLQEILIEEYDDVNHSYDTWFTKKQVYTYTEDGKLASEIKQNLVDGEWVNNTIHINLYDAYGKIVEQQDGTWSESLNDWDITKKVIHEYSMTDMTYTVSFYKKSGENWVWDSFRNQKLFFDPELKWQQREMKNFFWTINQFEFTLTYIVHSTYFDGSAWYYEIDNEDGSITYQHLEAEGDTVVQGKRPKIIIRSNTQYDRDTLFTEVTHEYVYEENGFVYWWNKDLEEFTTLYNLNAQVGDEWTIKVGTDSITMHVDDVDSVEYEGRTYRMLHVSDENSLFSGDIVCGIGHMTSFFPEKLMRRDGDYTVNGLRCYWVGDALLYHNGDEDCDAIYSEIHGVEEDGPSSGSGTLVVYPNPANDVLFVETRLIASPSTEYRITNLMGQTLMTGILNVRLPQCDSPTTIDVSNLPAGMYFITIDGATQKFIINR